MSARDALNAYLAHESDADQAEYEKRLDAYANEIRAQVLTTTERQFLTFALDLAFDRMVSEDGFTEDDHAALEKLQRMAAAPTSE
ncbi:hypothetical protein [Streptomyces albidoflavus]|uniref:hypothetical protein n=1 Tax=Streptomyces albidoflavus TaxID=1886 RepID=UPI000527C83E|nr:hypothetical protein [Streptomyces albidoflavus]